MASTFETVAGIIADTCDIEREKIMPDSHAINDLGIDSLDFLDVERVAGIAHHGFFFVGAFQLALTVHAKALRRLLRGQPLRHGHGGRGRHGRA